MGNTRATPSVFNVNADLNFNNNKVTNLQAGVADTDGVNVSQLNSAVSSNLGGWRRKGTIGTSGTVTASTLPAAASANEGWIYIVITAGTYREAADCQVNDFVVSDGTKWYKIDNTEKVTEVAGLSGNISVASLKSALGVQSVSSSTTNGNILINNTETVVYTLPTTLPASMITTSTNARFVTDAQIASWNSANSRIYGKLCSYSTTTKATFTESGTIKSGSLVVYRCGLRMLEGTGNDYTYSKSGSTVSITFTTPITAADVIQADYSLQ